MKGRGLINLSAKLAAIVLLALLGLSATPVFAQATTDELRKEAEDLADSLADTLKATTEQEITSDNVPAFVTDEPTQIEYYDESAKLGNDGSTALFTDPTAQTVVQSGASRPGITAEELSEWTTNGMAIEADGESIVTEYGGAYGDCTTEVSGGTEDTSFVYTCDEGETIQQTAHTCQITLDVQVEYDEEFFEYFTTSYWNDNDCAFEPSDDFIVFANHGCQFTISGGSGGLCIGEVGFQCNQNCGNLTYQALCPTPVPGYTPSNIYTGPPTITEAVDDSACTSFESDNDCLGGADICVEGPETRVINGEPITRECWKWERSYECVGLGGAVTDCEPPSETCQLIESTCLSEHEVTGQCLSTEHIYECTTEGSGGGAVGYCEEDVYCITGDCYTIEREQNDEFPEAVSALGLLGQLEEDSDADALEIFPGEVLGCDKAIFGLKNCCSVDGFLVSIFGCNQEEQELKARQEEGQCHFVGTFCDKKGLFGICQRKRRHFCCFNNKLARIVHQQGRPQIPRDFGEAEEPDCSGFTVAEFQMLDLSTVDFSEFYEDVLDEFAGPDPDGTVAGITQRILDTYACPPNC